MPRSAKIVGAALPVVALGGLFASYQAQAQPTHLDRVATSMASYDMRALVAGGGSADAAAAARMPTPASRSSAATKKTTQPARPSATRNSGATQPAGTHSAAPSPASKPVAKTLACSGAGGAGGTAMLPYNYATIVNFLVAHGYTKMAAVGIAGNIYQESDGNPESVGSGGGGLIGWTPLPSGFVTGNAGADLQTQLAALLTYNQGWAQYVPMLNAATNPTSAAYIYMAYFERPGLPAAANREGAAVAVAQACGI
ncbi:MAG TPA: phage tail tip lysozyme [Streptosporangiaceae bacterium]|nr:phage tail tip lysozyme [Streptosporangiaceae bacterium]